MKTLLGLAVIAGGIYLYFYLKSQPGLAPGTLVQMQVGTPTPATSFYQNCLKQVTRVPKGMTLQQWCRQQSYERI